MSGIVECFAQPLIKGGNAARPQRMRRTYDDDIFRFALVHGFYCTRFLWDADFADETDKTDLLLSSKMF